MLLQDIHMRDPYILPEKNIYYLYGTRGQDTWGEGWGFDVYTSSNLIEWQGPMGIFQRTSDFWADMNYWACLLYTSYLQSICLSESVSLLTEK